MRVWWLVLGGSVALTGCSEFLGLDDYRSGTAGAPSSAGPTGGSGGTGATATGGTASGGAGGAEQSVYESVVMSDGPIAYWRLGEPYRTQVAEELVHDLDGIYMFAQTGVTGLLVGDSDTAVSFTVDARVEVQDDALSFTGDKDFTVEAWIEPTELGYANIFSSAVSNPTEQNFNGYAVYVLNSGVCLARVDVAGMGQQPSCVGGLETLTTAHVVATYSRGSACVHVNAAMPNCAPQPVGVGMNTAYAVIGGLFEGTIDEVAVYTEKLSTERITAHYNAGKGF